MTKKIVFLDVDGTLCDDAGNVPESVMNLFIRNVLAKRSQRHIRKGMSFSCVRVVQKPKSQKMYWHCL